jgi:dTDP-4-amino-4,6-dideoxygalactose transaminase
MSIITDPSLEDIKIKNKILNNIKKILYSKNYILGTNVDFFEKEYAKFCGSKYALGVNSGTDALVISLLSQDIGKGDEVLVTAHSASGTATAIKLVGAKPKFIDIDENFYLTNPDKIKEKITKKTKAIIVVHIYGQSCNMKKILNIAKTFKILVIEDCAQAHGTLYENKHVGNYGLLGCFSFYPTKNLGAIGDAGCIVTNNKKVYRKIRALREFGWFKKFNSSLDGVNSRMDEIQASILRIKLKKLKFYNLDRKRIADYYFAELSKIKEIILPKIYQKSNHTFHQFVIRVPHFHRKKLIEHCKKNKIILGIHYPIPLHKQKAFSNQKEEMPVVEKICQEIVSLPIFTHFKLEDQKKVIKSIKNYFRYND